MLRRLLSIDAVEVEAFAPDVATTNAIVEFLTRIGVRVCQQALPADTFLPGVRIVAGALAMDRAALRWPGDLLHEAGHIATMPAISRDTLNDALDDSGVEHAGEIEATAWAYAAIVHLGLPADVLFHAGGYHGKAAALITTYGFGVYPGAHGLVQAGMALTGAAAQKAGVAPYPHMLRWLRE